MSLCCNCQISPSKYECLLCHNCFCLKCDSYIHSFPSKRTHLRKYITYSNQINNNTYQLYSNSNSDNLNNNQNNLDKNENNIFYGQRPEEMNQNEEDEFIISFENDAYAKKITNLGTEIMDTRENFENKIEALHEQFHNMNEIQKQKMNELNDKNLKEINLISSEKEIQIQRLKEILEEQNEIINQLKEENNNLVNVYNQNRKEIEEVNQTKKTISKENEKLEEMNKKKIEEIIAMNEEEKKKLIEEYDEELVKLKEKYNNTEEHLESALKEKQKNLNDFMEEKEKEESELNFMIDNLRLNNQNKEKDTQKLKKVNEELQKIFNDREEQYKSMKEVVATGNNNRNNQVRASVTTASDSIYCERLGNNAVHAAMAGKTKCVIGLVHDKFVHLPIKAVTAHRNAVDPEGSLWRDCLDATGQPILMCNDLAKAQAKMAAAVAGAKSKPSEQKKNK